MRFLTLLTLLFSYTLVIAAPIPNHLIVPLARVDEVVPYGDSSWKIAEIRQNMNGYWVYRLVDPNPVNEWVGIWMSDLDMGEVLKDKWYKTREFPSPTYRVPGKY